MAQKITGIVQKKTAFAVIAVLRVHPLHDKVQKMRDKGESVLCIFEFKILYAYRVPLFEPQLLKDLYASLLHNVIVQVSHGTAVVEIRGIEYL